MAERGAPLGNHNAARGKVWRSAIERALDRRTKRRADGMLEIDALADRLIDAADAGDLAALKELGDRVEGKPAQAIVGDPEGPPVGLKIEVEYK